MRRLPPHNLEPSTTDGDVLTTEGGKVVWGTGDGGRIVVPLIAVVDGSPEFVFDADNQLVMTEVPR